MEGTVRDATVHSMRSVLSITSCKRFDSVPAAPVTILEGYNNHEVACTDRTLGDLLSTYLRKMAGGVDTPLKPAPVMELVASFIGAFLSILLVSACQRWLSPRVSLPLMIASFGATAVLLFGAPESKMAQPRNCLGRFFGLLQPLLAGLKPCPALTRLGLGSAMYQALPVPCFPLCMLFIS